MRTLSAEWLKAAHDDLAVIEKIHKLKTLSMRVGIDLSLFDNAEDYLHLLDELYIESRYPGDFGLLPSGKPTQQDAQEFYDFAKSIYKMVKDEL